MRTDADSVAVTDLVAVFRFAVSVTVFVCGSLAFAEDPACARGIAELRRGPGSQFPVSWKVAKYTPFLKHEAKGAYVKVTDQDGEIHWARQKDLTTRHGCVSVRSQVAMLRRDPSKSAPPAELKTADRYTPFKRVESKAEWIRIEDESGRQAWIHESQVWKPMKVNSISF